MRQRTARRGRRVAGLVGAVVCVGLGSGAGGVAWGRVITFDPLVPSSSQPSYSEDGYTLTATPGTSIFVVGNFPPYTTAPSVFSSTSGAVFTLEAPRPFDVRSIRMAGFDATPQAVTFTGTLADGGGTVTQTFTTTSGTPQVFTFSPAFARLSSLAWDPKLTIEDDIAVGHGPVMTFSGLVPGAGATYAENGFALDATLVGVLNGGNTLPGVEAGDGQYVLPSHSLSRFRFTAAGGAPFDLFGIDLSPLNASVGPRSVLFTGTKADGGTVEQIFYTTGDAAMQPFYFGPEFSGLVSVEWNPGLTAMDNIEAGLSVPEPAGLAVVGAVLGVGVLRRRRGR